MQLPLPDHFNNMEYVSIQLFSCFLLMFKDQKERRKAYKLFIFSTHFFRWTANTSFPEAHNY